MLAPTIDADVVEQAIYTWSTRNLTGGSKGQGFGALSPGLMSSTPWLRTITTGHFQIFDGVGSEHAAFDGWRQLVAHGSFRAGDLTVVYRKIFDAGIDGVGRGRNATHLLLGPTDVFDIGDVSDDAAIWLTAAQVPLDELPKLAPIPRRDCPPVDASHDCSTVDQAAEDLLRNLVESAGTVTYTGVDPRDVRRLLLVALPAPLWPALSLDVYAGAAGPVSHVALHDTVLGARATLDRVGDSGLSACAHHRKVEALFSTLSQATWSDFVSTYTGKPTRQPTPTADAPSPEAPRTAAAAPARHQVRAAIAAAAGRPSYDPAFDDIALDETEASRALSVIARLDAPTVGWAKALEASDWWALLSSATTRPAFAAANRFLSTTPTPELLSLWRSTGLAAVAAAFLRRDDRAGITDTPRWAIPRRVDGNQLAALAGHLYATEPGVDQLAELLAGGLAAHAEARQHIIAVVGTRPRLLFDTVLAQADLPAAVLLEIIRDNIELFGDWLRLDECYRAALQLGLARRRKRGLQLPALHRRHD